MPGEKRICEGLNSKGKPCRSWARPGRPYCARHDPDLSDADRQRLIAGKWGRHAPALRAMREDRTHNPGDGSEDR